MHLTDNPLIELKEMLDRDVSFLDLLELNIDASDFVLALSNSLDSAFIGDDCGAKAATVAC